MRFPRLERLEEGLIAFLLAAMTVVTFVQVIARYVFNFSFTWALELTTWLFAWMIFLGIPYGVRVGSHIGVDALVKSLGPRAARAAGVIGAMLCIAYSVILLVGSWNYVAKMYEIGIMAEDLPVPQWVPRAILLVSFGTLLLRFSQVLYRIAAGRETRLHLGDESAEALKLHADLDHAAARSAEDRP